MNAFDSIVAKFMGSRSDRELKSYRPLVDKIHRLEAKMEACSDEQLAAFTAEFRQRIENGEPLDSLIPETFAVVREVGKRTLNMRHFDVQLLGGMVLHHGNVAEMKTGERHCGDADLLDALTTRTATYGERLSGLSGRRLDREDLQLPRTERGQDPLGRRRRGRRRPTPPT